MPTATHPSTRALDQKADKQNMFTADNIPVTSKHQRRQHVIRYWTPTKNTCKMPIFDEYTLDKLVNLGHLLIYFISKCYITMFLRTIL